MSRERRTVVTGILIVVAAVAVFLAVAVASHRSTSAGSSPGSDSHRIEWTGMLSQLEGHYQTLKHNQAAGNAQGALDANTKLAADCDEAGLLSPGGGGDEATVRQACRELGFPLP